MPYLSRAQWGAAPPVKTTPASKHLKGVAIHWVGLPVHDDPATITRAIQRNHMGPPKFWDDIAYGELIAQDGTVVEGRGLTYRTAANGNTSVNRKYAALCLLIGPGQVPTDWMVDAVKERIAVVRFFQPGATKIVGHKDLRPTDCPGPDVHTMILAGMFEPGSIDVPPPATIEDQLRSLDARVAKIEHEMAS